MDSYAQNRRVWAQNCKSSQQVLPFHGPASPRQWLMQRGLSLGPRQLSGTPSPGGFWQHVSRKHLGGSFALDPKFPEPQAPSASDFSASESQVDKKWRKQMVGLKFLFARMAWKESFPQGVSASDLLFFSEENSLSRSEPACPRFWPRRPRGDQSTAQEAGPGVGGEGCLLTFPLWLLVWRPASLLFPAWWTWGFAAPFVLAAAWRMPPVPPSVRSVWEP